MIGYNFRPIFYVWSTPPKLLCLKSVCILHNMTEFTIWGKSCTGITYLICHGNAAVRDQLVIHI